MICNSPKKIVALVSLLFLGCGPYSFTGISIGPNTKTFQVNYFQNTSDLIEPGIERDFTLALQDIILNQTNLSLVKSNGDILYEGEITEYRISPTTATANNTADQNRLTISVNVRFFNKNDEKADFEKRFEVKARDPISTGWDEIDNLCRGGIGNGDLGVVIYHT